MMSHPMVVNVRRDIFDVYIGRRSGLIAGSIWANPFKIGRDGTREEVIEKFRTYLKGNGFLLKRIHELKGKRLGCWCAPLPCHGDILAELANKETLK